MQVPNEDHVVVLVFPFGTHVTPLLTLTRCLSSLAPNLRFSFLNSAKSNAKVFSKIKPDDYRNIKPCNVDNGMLEDHVFSGHPLEVVELFLRAMPRNFEIGLKEVVANTGTKITCLLTDSFFWFATNMETEMGVPWMALWTASPCSISIHMYIDVIRSTMKGIENGDQTLDFIPGMNTIRAKDLPGGVIHGNLDVPFSQMLHKMGLAMPKATALAMNAFEEIDPTITKDLKSKLKMILNVGPFDLASPPKLYSDDSGCIRYHFEPPHPTHPANELIALEAQKVVPWNPQLQVLENSSVGVFTTHAGWNLVSESIAGCVTIICRPFFADQMLNSRLVVDIWQIGTSVEGGTLTNSGTTRALELVFSSEKGKKMRENIDVLKAKAKMAVGENGSSTKNFTTLLNVVSGCEEIP